MLGPLTGLLGVAVLARFAAVRASTQFHRTCEHHFCAPLCLCPVGCVQPGQTHSVISIRVAGKGQKARIRKDPLHTMKYTYTCQHIKKHTDAGAGTHAFAHSHTLTYTKCHTFAHTVSQEAHLLEREKRMNHEGSSIFFIGCCSSSPGDTSCLLRLWLALEGDSFCCTRRKDNADMKEKR